MSDFEGEISSLQVEMENFLRSVARKEPTSSQPLVLRIEYKNSLKLNDKNKQQFSVEESFLSAFRDIYTDKSFKAVRLHNWEFELQFEGKRCKKISLISDSVVFLASKSVKKEITGCLFKVSIVEKEEELKRFSPELNGYLNRLGKRHLCSYSKNIAEEATSLMSFIPVEQKKAPSYNYKPFVRPDQEALDPVNTLSAEGRKILEKLRHFITRQQIYDFIVEQEVSEQSASELRKLVVGGK